jgi:sugar O-acyltransferase (sialic acid O-acetyltransferase NeuD family)
VTDVLLAAAGGLAREVLAAEAPGIRVVGLLDDDPARHGAFVHGIPVLGSIASAAERPESLVVCAGAGRSRRSIVARLAELGVGPERYATVVDESVRIPRGSTVGEGSIVLRGVVLTVDVTIGRHVVLMPGGVLTHDDLVHDFATLAAGVVLGGGVVVGSGAYLGMASSVRQGLAIGEDATLGMGAALLTDLPAGEVWAGVPARGLRPVDPSSHSGGPQ